MSDSIEASFGSCKTELERLHFKMGRAVFQNSAIGRIRPVAANQDFSLQPVNKVKQLLFNNSVCCLSSHP